MARGARPPSSYNLEGSDGVGGGREYVYAWLINVDVWQKPTQYCKAIILQSKTEKIQQSNKKWAKNINRYFIEKEINLFICKKIHSS